jgi:hypothetical protein
MVSRVACYVEGRWYVEGAWKNRRSRKIFGSKRGSETELTMTLFFTGYSDQMTVLQ